MNRDGRDRDGRENNGRRNDRRDSRPSSVDTMDLGLARKPVRDVKSKEKDKEKEREREEKKTQDRRSGQVSYSFTASPKVVRIVSSFSLVSSLHKVILR